MKIFGINLFRVLRRRRSAPVARERLQILLEYERRIVNQTDLIAVLRRDIIAVVERHVAVDRKKVQVRVDRGDAVSRLEVGVEIPNTWRYGRERSAHPPRAWRIVASWPEPVIAIPVRGGFSYFRHGPAA